MRTSTPSPEYIKQVITMSQRADVWRKANPTREVKIQYNYPAHAFVIITMSDALENGAVTANDAGKELIRALWPEGGELEPTAFMVELALGIPAQIKQTKNEREQDCENDYMERSGTTTISHQAV